MKYSILRNALNDYSHQMVGLSQREAGEQGFPNWILLVVLLVDFAIEGDLSMKDATCQVSKVRAVRA